MNQQQTKFQKFLQPIREKFEELETYFKRNASKIYVAIFLFSCLFYVSVFTSMFILKKELPIIPDEISATKQINYSSKLILKDRQYNKKTGLLYQLIELSNDNFTELITPQLAFSFDSNGLKGNAKIEVVQIDRTNYAVYISGLTEWNGIRLKIEIGQNNSKNTHYFITINNKNLIVNDALVIQNQLQLMTELLQKQIQTKEKSLENLNQKISEYEKQIEQFKNEINILEQEKNYKTESEIKTLTEKIGTLNKEISKNNSLIRNIPEQKKVIENEIKELQNKVKTLQK